MNEKLENRDIKRTFASQHKGGAVPKEKMLARRPGARPLLDEAARYTVAQSHQPSACSGTDKESLGSCAFFCSLVGQFRSSLFVSVNAEVEDVIWVVKEMADQKLNNTLRHSMSSFPLLCSTAPLLSVTLH